MSRARLLALMAVTVVAVALAFAAGRATRPDAPAAAGAPTLERGAVEVSLPALAVAGRVPALKEAPEQQDGGGEQAVAPLEPAAPQVSAAPQPQQSAPAPTSGGGSETPAVVGGGTE